MSTVSKLTVKKLLWPPSTLRRKSQHTVALTATGTGSLRVLPVVVHAKHATPPSCRCICTVLFRNEIQKTTHGDSSSYKYVLYVLRTLHSAYTSARTRCPTLDPAYTASFQSFETTTKNYDIAEVLCIEPPILADECQFQHP